VDSFPLQSGGCGRERFAADYRFDEAANRIYDFFWGEFCDWYIELIKPRLNFEEGADTAAARACANLVNCLRRAAAAASGDAVYHGGNLARDV
jgi:valyl-tRNA synthetase